MTAVTLLLLAIVIYSARDTLLHALELMSQVNIWILALVVPAVTVSYLASGEMVFSYLRQKGLIKDIKPTSLMRISMELNFVNHVLPSGGVSGVTYLNWRMGKLGVSPARATMAQAVRYVAGFASSSVLLLLSLLLVTIDGTVSRWVILMSAVLIIIMMASTGFLYLAVSNKQRCATIARNLTRWVNGLVRKVTLGKVQNLLDAKTVQTYFEDLNADYVELMQDKKLLIKPFLWGLLLVTMDIAMFWITFWALGTYVNPATILISYSLATIVGLLFVTPGGVGAYETIMASFIVMSGVSQADAIAGVILARTIILLVTIVGGYIFYQQAIVKYGKAPEPVANP